MARKKSPMAIFVLFLLCSTSGFAPSSSAQLAESAVGVAMVGAAGVAIVDRLEQKFQSVNAQAVSTANIATGNAFIAIKSVLGGLRQAFSEERQATFDNLSNERKAIIVQVYGMIDQIEKGVSLQRGYIKADAVDLMNGANLLTKKARFMVTAIDPVSFAWRESGNYEMQVLGVGLGLPSSTQKYEVSVEVDGVKLPPESLSPYVNMLKIKLPDELINARFAESNKINQVPVKITSTHSVRCGLLWLKNCPESYSLTFNANLYPKVVGYAVLKQIRPRDTLVNKKVILTNEIATGDHHNRPEAVYGSGPISAPPGWRVTRAWYDPGRCRPAQPGDNGTCVFFSGPNCTIQGAAASCTVAQGSHPKIFQFSYEIAEEKTVPEDLPPSAPISFAAAQAKSIQFDRNATKVSADVSLADGRRQTYSIKPNDSNLTPYLTCGPVAHLASAVSETDCSVNLTN